MIGRAHHYRIDVLVGEQFVIVRVAGDAVVGLTRLLGVEIVHEFLAVFDAMGIQIADRNDAGTVVLQNAGHVVRARNAAQRRWRPR